MSEKQLTFEEVNAHFEKANLSIYEEGGEKHFTASSVSANPTGVLQSICGIYKVVRPFLSLVLIIPMPASWRAAITTFMRLMDQLCPS